MDPRLAEMREAWHAKASLRALYADYYRRIGETLAAGRTLEVGAGFGNLKHFDPATISIDVLAAPGLDAMADAQRLPFAAGSFANIVMVDVLHHIERPLDFFHEAARVLRPGGRLALLEPAITPISWAFYHFLHPEPVDCGADPMTAEAPDPDRDAFDANQAIPTLLFGRCGARFRAAFPELAIVSQTRLSLFAYPLSGGYRQWSLIPRPLIRPVLACEDALLPILGPAMAFRMLVVLERQ
ncbi:MAG: class I SAM-dependent methyltransferase [Rhodospirillaceae bacterium]|jgi:SAM-dependent methyltransferase|nr:class I SAM-dependent methyltransferase [Rhodospirillaceae bacterium]MBT6117074.1 class I SAM-dependent methyltransferase [Rhodospirillaceae bacterium]